MKTKLITLLPPYSLQKEIEEDTHRFRVISCGRRWGKTLMAMREAFQIMLQRYTSTGRKQRGWVVAPTFPLVKESWMTAEEILKDAIIDKKLTDMKMVFDIGFLEFKSAERGADGLIGAGLDLAVMDEAKLISKASWEEGVRPALGDKQGKAIFISTPRGKGFFYELFLKGKNNEGGQWKSWQYPTYSNPFFPKEEWETILKNTPERILKQEYLAEFLEDEASVFHNLSSCYRGILEEPIDNEQYVFGFDLARTYDFTVGIGIKKSTKQIVYISRHKETDWSLQKELIRAVSLRYNRAKVLLDSTGVGDPIEEDLHKAGCNVQGYKFNNTTKQEIIEQLIVAIEQGLIGIPQDPKTQFLIDELKAFEYELLPTGRIRYQAPAGLHDDSVIALGLAVMGVRHILYNHIKSDEVKVEEGTFKWWRDRIKKTNYLSRLPQNRNFNHQQIWEHVNA